MLMESGRAIRTSLDIYRMSASRKKPHASDKHGSAPAMIAASIAAGKASPSASGTKQVYAHGVIGMPLSEGDMKNSYQKNKCHRSNVRRSQWHQEREE